MSNEVYDRTETYAETSVTPRITGYNLSQCDAIERKQVYYNVPKFMGTFELMIIYFI
jgi:hypothetical protein